MSGRGIVKILRGIGRAQFFCMFVLGMLYIFNGIFIGAVLYIFMGFVACALFCGLAEIIDVLYKILDTRIPPAPVNAERDGKTEMEMLPELTVEITDRETGTVEPEE